MSGTAWRCCCAVRHRRSVAAFANHRFAGFAACRLCRRRWCICDFGRGAGGGAWRALPIAGSGGSDEPDGHGCRPRLAGARHRRAVCSPCLCLGRGHRSTVAGSSSPAFRPARSLGSCACRHASVGWGALATVADISDVRVIRLWLVGYAVVFGGALLVLAGRLQRRHWLASEPA
jgi:hypothetical protein